VKAKQKIWPNILKLLSASVVVLLTGCLAQSVYQLPHMDDQRMVGVWKVVWSEDKGSNQAGNVFVVKHVGDAYQLGESAVAASSAKATKLIVSRLHDVVYVQYPVQDVCNPALEPDHGCFAIARIVFSGDEARVFTLDPERLAVAAKNSPSGIGYEFIPRAARTEPQILLKSSTPTLASFLDSLSDDPSNFILAIRLQKID
jgi:hypothetical protein